MAQRAPEHLTFRQRQHPPLQRARALTSHPFRRELIAGVVVLIVSCIGVAAWFRRDVYGGPCCFAFVRNLRDAPIGADPYLRTDTLPNGLRYYIRENHASNRRVEVRLVVDAGSVLEDDDQRGLAHAVEHMVFRGTRDFPGRTIDQYLESLGMRGGEEANAFTSFDETVFQLTLPADRPRVLDSALAILAGMAHDALFDSAAARSEAGVVLEEWRSKRDAGQRVADEQYGILLAGSPYAARRVIGDTAVLRRFDLRAMRRFYDRWYRPEAMAVVVVGTIDADDAQDLVARYFGRLPRGSMPYHRSLRAVRRSPGVRAAVLTDVEATGTRVAIWHPRRPRTSRLRSEYRTALVGSLWRAILAMRLEEAADDPGSPIVSAGVSSRRIARPLSADVVSAMTTKDRALPTLDVLVAEMEHLARDGATPQEVKQRAATLLEQARSSAEAGESSVNLASEFVEHFLTGNAPITDRAAHDLARDLLPGITAADVTGFARQRMLDSGTVVIVTASRVDSAASIPPASLIARARAATARPIVARAVSAQSRPLVARAPVRGRIAAEREIPEVQAWEWILSNGMRVILKPTDFSSDEIQLRAVAPGGASLASDPDYPSAWLSDAIIQRTGIGEMNGTRLARLLDTTSISLDPTVSDDAITLQGSTAARDVDTFFQLVHLYFTAPRNDTVAFRRYRDQMLSSARERERDPDSIFSDTLAAAVSGHHPRSLTSSTRFYESMRLPAALDFWAARMSNASAFTVVLTGDFEPRAMRPLVERYLASLPAGRKEQPRDVGSRPNAAVVRREVVAGIAGRARTRLVLSGPFSVTSRAVEELKEVRDMLEPALDERLRETLGGTYGVTVEYDVDLLPPYHYSIAIDFDAAPQRIDSLVTVALAEVERLRVRGPSDAEFAATRAARIHDYDGRLESNDYWTRELAYHARLGWSLATIATHREDVEKLTLDELRRACATYLVTTTYTQVTLRPRGSAHRAN